MTTRKRAQPELPGLGRIPGRPVARIRRGVEAQLRAQRKLGHLETVDKGLIALARTLADAADAEHVSPEGSRFTVGSLSGRLVRILLELRGDRLAGGDDFDAEHAALVAALRHTPRP